MYKVKATYQTTRSSGLVFKRQRIERNSRIQATGQHNDLFINLMKGMQVAIIPPLGTLFTHNSIRF